MNDLFRSALSKMITSASNRLPVHEPSKLANRATGGKGLGLILSLSSKFVLVARLSLSGYSSRARARSRAMQHHAIRILFAREELSIINQLETQISSSAMRARALPNTNPLVRIFHRPIRPQVRPRMER